MKILLQFGNKGPSLFDHLISPLSKVRDLTGVAVVCRHPGPSIPKVEYHCPPGLLAKNAVLAVIYEFLNLFYLALFDNPGHIAGFLLNPHGLIAFIVAKLTGRKAVISIIGGIPELYADAEGSIAGIDFNTTGPPWFGRLFLKILNHADAVITTGSVTKLFLTRHNIEERKIYPMINPANHERFHPLPVPKQYDLISVGYLSQIKHHEILLFAVSKIKQNYPNIRVCVVGTGPRQSELLKLASELGINDNMDFVGYQTDTPHYYNISRIFVHTSEREGFPNVFLESMMCGLPGVVSNCGDIMDVARDGFNALVVNRFDDVEGFTRAIISLLENEELYQKISQNVLQAAASFSTEEIMRQWEMLFQLTEDGRKKEPERNF